MALRSIASGNVSFGLVSIPVKLYSSTQSGSHISFNMLHKDCGGRLKQQYICSKDQKQVSREDTVKGFEFAKDQYVIFSPEELKALEEKSTQAIEITEFVPEDKVDPVYFDGSYYLGPDKGGDKPYRLLCEAMRKTGRAALAKYSARGKQYLVLLRPLENGMVMQQLHYSDEIRAFSEVPIGEGEVKEPELKLALQLIDQIASDEFHPESYKDEVKERIQGVIDQKVAGHEVSLSPTEAPQAQIIDLMEALKASIGAAKTQTEERKPAKRTEAKAEKPAKKSKTK
jgi:DNA end-binding protein Ku